jgi:hypothetical protein
MSEKSGVGTENGTLQEHEVVQLLDALCVKYGFCLPPRWKGRLSKNPPRTIRKFVDTVIRVEGLNPETLDSDLYTAMLRMVQDAFQRSASTRE